MATSSAVPWFPGKWLQPAWVYSKGVYCACFRTTFQCPLSISILGSSIRGRHRIWQTLQLTIKGPGPFQVKFRAWIWSVHYHPHGLQRYLRWSQDGYRRWTGYLPEHLSVGDGNNVCRNINDTSPAQVSIIGNAVNEPPPWSVFDRLGHIIHFFAISSLDNFGGPFEKRSRAGRIRHRDTLHVRGPSQQQSTLQW